MSVYWTVIRAAVAATPNRPVSVLVAAVQFGKRPESLSGCVRRLRLSNQSPQSMSICKVELGARQAVGGHFFADVTDDRYKRWDGAVSRGQQRAEPPRHCRLDQPGPRPQI